jgi:hypothetical protein
LHNIECSEQYFIIVYVRESISLMKNPGCKENHTKLICVFNAMFTFTKSVFVKKKKYGDCKLSFLNNQINNYIYISPYENFIAITLIVLKKDMMQFDYDCFSCWQSDSMLLTPVRRLAAHDIKISENCYFTYLVCNILYYKPWSIALSYDYDLERMSVSSIFHNLHFTMVTIILEWLRYLITLCQVHNSPAEFGGTLKYCL